tara:strand:+ start:123 stop:389 length:267 start_codon:yes stop_codon:yes gene_type:complete
MQEIKEYEKAVENIAIKFCKIFKSHYNKADWTGGEIGDVLAVGDLFVNLNDMLIVLKMGATKQEFISYYDAVMEGEKINLENWLRKNR